MSLQDSLNTLKDTVAQTNKMIAATENTINASMDSLMKNANSNELQSIQKQVMQVKSLLVKAKTGQNVDAEISNIANNINNGRRD